MTAVFLLALLIAKQHGSMNVEPSSGKKGMNDVYLLFCTLNCGEVSNLRNRATPRTWMLHMWVSCYLT